MKRTCLIFPHSKSGFSLVELLVALAIFGILMTMVFSSFIPVVQHNSQQGRISETKLETAIGLDLLRADLEHAGFGLPWSFDGGVPNPYNELAASAPVVLNDGPNNVPRALSSVAGAGLNTSDYLAIKALNVTRGATSQKWGWLWRDAAHNATIQSMSAETFAANDRVIVIQPRENRRLVVDGANLNKFFATITPNVTTTADALKNFSPDESPLDPDGERYLLYGLNLYDPSSPAATPQRPFNRTDYYINNANPPAHCGPGTGVLTKRTLNQSDNSFLSLPIVDCVADFQVVYYLDNDGDGGWDTRADANGLNGMNAEEIRSRVKAIHCYILTHEGGIDRNYNHPTATVNVGEVEADGTTLFPNAGRAFVLNANIGATWANYRWKVYSLAVTPRNLQ